MRTRGMTPFLLGSVIWVILGHSAFGAESTTTKFPDRLRIWGGYQYLFGLVAKVNGTLLDTTTIVADIDENGGVAINAFGDVAFHGDAVDPAVGGDSVKAVFTQDGLVAKVGDILPDGTPLEDIEVKGGVAINLFGDVTFHGRTGGVKAVFTQDGLVAKVGDNLSDGTTLDEIWDSAGVAINPFGSEVAFHGKAGAADAVFVGLAPIVVPPAESEEMSSE